MREMEEVQAQKLDESSKRKKRVWKFLKKVLFAIIWMYILVKLFVYDFDIYFLSKFCLNGGLSLLKYKGFILIGILFIFLLFLKPKRFLANVVHFGAFPIIVVLWYFPKLLFKGTVGMLHKLLVVLSLLHSLKVRITVWVGTFVSSVIIVSDVSYVAIIVCMCYLLIFLFLHLGSRFLHTFAPMWFFQKANKLIDSYWRWLKEYKIIEYKASLEKLQADPEKYQKERKKSLIRLLLINRFLGYLAGKLRLLEESRLVILYLLASLAFTFMVTVVIFALEYYGLSLVDPGAFASVRDLNFLHSLYFSFTTITTMESTQIQIVSDYARALVSLEVLSAIVIGGILFFIFTTIILERYQTGLQDLISRLDREASEIATIAEKTWELEMDQIETEVTEKSPDLAPVFKKLKLKE